ncbi:transcriptional repressor NrdR [Candidatus Woesearchaeota archaeon]|nr:transcriptional repressor NrdR [Candidatus Woesearchaeota archaeon]
MRCPYCQHTETKVLDSRESENAVRRRRECLQCEKRFTTYERVEMVDLLVVKKDGRREAFDRAKLMKGLVKACEKRPITMEVLEKVVHEIEQELRKRDSVEIPSNEIGELVMAKLKQLDKVAYIRFASVYREFEDIAHFQKEVFALLQNKGDHQ